MTEFIKPAELAEKTGWSLRRLKAFAREIGACRIVGGRMIFTEEDVAAILEASRPTPTRRPSPAKASSYEELVRFRARQQNIGTAPGQPTAQEALATKLKKRREDGYKKG